MQRPVTTAAGFAVEGRNEDYESTSGTNKESSLASRFLGNHDCSIVTANASPRGRTGAKGNSSEASRSFRSPERQSGSFPDPKSS